MRWTVERYAVSDKGKTLARVICLGQAIAVCDGSYKDSFGTAAYVIEGATSMNQLIAMLVALGNSSDQSSYQSNCRVYTVWLLWCI